jgi:hypothetical protein
MRGSNKDHTGCWLLPSGVLNMSKERKSNKEEKKKPLLTPKERKAAKLSKKDSTKFMPG